MKLNSPDSPTAAVPHGFNEVGIVGTGAMGQGIAQMSAQAGATVHLFDVSTGAAQAAHANLLAMWAKLQAKGKITPEQATSLQPTS
jgi:3-hydroxybutyryl-CoA dehydrogenase